MTRLVSFGLITLALALPACSNSTPDAEPPPPPPPPLVIPPPPPPFVDPLPGFKKSSREFLDFAKKLDQHAKVTPPPPYQSYWKESEPLEEIYAAVIRNEPKSGPGANAFERINNIRDSLFKTRLLLKNSEDLRASKLSQALDLEAGKRAAYFDEAEFFWKQTPEFTKRED